MTTLHAFHNDAAVRDKYLNRVEQHRIHDEIVKGQYWEGGKGCAVGCILHSDRHSVAETEIGVPTWLMRLIDGIFENLPNGEAKDFPGAFLSAIPLGANLAPVRDKFLAWLMEDEKFGLAHMAEDAEIKELAAEVGRRLRTGEGVTGKQAEILTKKLNDARAARAARDTWDAWAARAARDAWAARDTWDAWAARAARDAWAARDARDTWDAWDARDTWDAWDARDTWDTWDTFVIASRDKLLALLSEATP